ncbi:MAG TPA: delta-60 repeat domain-containing protein [Flavobacteriales bacterium]|nr:delta-60 repeat domain-containing protein [Flavobacteriales bacterium]
MKHQLLFPAFAAALVSHAQPFRDVSFGTDGYVIVDVDGSFEQFKEMAVMSDGRIVAAGHASYGGDTNPFVARFTSAGALDPSFSGDGWTLGPDTNWYRPGDYHGMALQPDGRIVCAGTARPSITDVQSILVVRYLVDGTLDPAFGSGGYTIVEAPFDNTSYAHDVVVAPDGSILVCGFSDTDDSGDFEVLVVKLSADGTLDPSFGTGGLAPQFIGNTNLNSRARGLALQSDGRIVLATEGRADTTIYGTIWGVRLHPDGTMDGSFGVNGLLLNFEDGDYAQEVSIGANDEVFLVGHGSIQGSLIDLIGVRYDAAGQNGVQSYYECSSTVALLGCGAWMQADGGALALGMGADEIHITKWMPDGSLDPDFGLGGVVSETAVSIGSVGGDSGGFGVDANGRIIVCGRSGLVQGNGDDAIVMAFLPGAVGIEEDGGALRLDPFPNPASDRVLIEVDEALIGEHAVIELCDATGRRVLAVEDRALTPLVELHLPPHLHEGVYALMLRTEGRSPRAARVVLER